MENNKIQDYLNYLEDSYSVGSKLIDWDDSSNFERSYRLNFKLDYVRLRLDYIHRWSLSIGKEVYTSNKKFDYVLVSEYNKLNTANIKNFDETKSSTFTKEMFDTLCIDYIKFSYDFLLDELLNQSILSNSTNKFSNLIFEWKLECRQQLINDFKGLILNY